MLPIPTSGCGPTGRRWCSSDSDGHFHRSLLPVAELMMGSPACLTEQVSTQDPAWSRPAGPRESSYRSTPFTPPQAAANLMVRIKNSPRNALQLFCVAKKIATFVHVLRKGLHLLGARPRSPRNWVDLYPDNDPVLRSQSTQKIAQQQEDIALRKTHHHLSRHSQISGTLSAAQKEPATAVAPTDRLSRLVNIPAPRKARDEDRVIASLGCNPSSCMHRHSGTRVFPARVSHPLPSLRQHQLLLHQPVPPLLSAACHTIVHRSPQVGSVRFSARSPSPRYQPIQRVISVQPSHSLSPSPAPFQSLSIMGGHTRVVQRVSPAPLQRPPSPLCPQQRIQSPLLRKRFPSPLLPQQRVWSPSPLRQLYWSSPTPQKRWRVRSQTPPWKQYLPASPT
jgi:hypothetical protein